MSDDKNLWKWKQFVDIENTIQDIKGVARFQMASNAYGLSADLTESGYIRANEDRFILWREILLKLAEYMDGNVEVLQSTVREYFLGRHCAATGSVCDVFGSNENGGAIRYNIKTYQFGPTASNPKSVALPDLMEVFVYKLLYRIGMGPEPHFIIPLYGSKKSLYIATKECFLKPLDQVAESPASTRAMVQLDLISRILCLHDCTTNGSNCGLVDGKPMIVDFHIQTRLRGYVKSDILVGFYAGNREFAYSGLMAMAVKPGQDEKKREIMTESLHEWGLIESIDKVVREMDETIAEFQGQISFENDLEEYVKDVKATVEILSKESK